MKTDIKLATETLLDYMATYSKQTGYEKFKAETFIDDVLYGLGIALDRESHEFAQGFTKFKIETLVPHLDKWFPIETAPKAGTELLLYDEKTDEMMVGREVIGSGWVDTIDGCFALFPTHWKPKPKAPNARHQGQNWSGAEGVT